MRTVIRDISTRGAELDESALAKIAGGRPAEGKGRSSKVIDVVCGTSHSDADFG